MSKFQAELSEVLSRRTQEVLALFENELSDVRFPDVDVEVLEALGQHVLEAQREVERAERALEALRTRRTGHVEALEAVALRALAYARVFADGDAELRERVAAVDREGAVAAPPAAAGKRGRPKKRAAVESDLFTEESASLEGLDAQSALM